MENALKGDEKVNILSPQVALNFKGKDAVRFYILIKCPRGKRNEYVYFLDNFNKIIVEEKIDCNMDIDVNPYSTY